MTSYGLVTFRHAAGPRAGLLVDGAVVELGEALHEKAPGGVIDLLDRWDEVLPELDALAADTSTRRIALSDLNLLAPVPNPLAIYCMGANYQKHLDNMMRARGNLPQANARDAGMPPFFFLKSGHCVVPTETDVLRSGEMLDWEAELVAVIGRKARNIGVDQALDCVAGYAIANDLSARDRITRKNGDPSSPFFFDFVSQKSFDGSCPVGPSLVPARFVLDPQALRIRLWINERLRIDASTAEMIYPVAEQIAHLSTFTTLYPGDLILTGTPAGVGAETNEYLQTGDIVRIEIEGLGRLTNRIV